MSLKTKRKYLKKLLCMVMAFACVFSVVLPYTPTASAEESLEDLRNQYEDLEKEILQNQQALSQVQSELKTNEQKLDSLNDEIKIIEKQMDVLDERINVLNGSISDLQVSIDTAENDIEGINNQVSMIQIQIADSEALMSETKSQLLARLRENYMSGGSGSTLELLLTSDDISSFFARKELVTRVSENDNELIAELSEKLIKLEELKKQSEEQKTQLDTQMTSLNAKQNDLQSSKDAQQNKKNSATSKKNEVKYLLEDLDKDSEEYKAAIKRQEKERAALEAEIEEGIKAQGSTENDVPDEEYNNDGEMLWPVPGSTRLTATYPSYSDGSPHWGIDIVRTDVTTKGSPFRAAQGGEVILALNDGNWNYGFGNYCIIDHGDGKHTLYAHAQTLYVSKGDIVQKGEKIGLIGDTGNTTGPHLHFEVRIKNSNGDVSRVNPLNYVSKP